MGQKAEDGAEEKSKKILTAKERRGCRDKKREENSDKKLTTKHTKKREE